MKTKETEDKIRTVQQHVEDLQELVNGLKMFTDDPDTLRNNPLILEHYYKIAKEHNRKHQVWANELTKILQQM